LIKRSEIKFNSKGQAISLKTGKLLTNKNGKPLTKKEIKKINKAVKKQLAQKKLLAKSNNNSSATNKKKTKQKKKLTKKERKALLSSVGFRVNSAGNVVDKNGKVLRNSQTGKKLTLRQAVKRANKINKKEKQLRQAAISGKTAGLSKVDLLSPLFDDFDKFGRPRSAASIAARKLLRAKRKALELKKKLLLERARKEKLAIEKELAEERAALKAGKGQVDVNGRPIGGILVRDADGKLVVSKPRIRKNQVGPPLPAYPFDGNCKDPLGCDLPEKDDSMIMPHEAIKMLPVVPQYISHEEVDEYGDKIEHHN